MQISRHWRMNPQRYRLEGVRYANGETSLQSRPAPVEDDQDQPDSENMESQAKEAVAVVAV